MFGYSQQRTVTTRKLLLVLAAIACAALCGCSAAVIVRDPATGEMTDCGSHYAFGFMNKLVAEQHAEACVADYRAQGWLRSPR